MRKITPAQIICFFTLFLMAIGCAFFTTDFLANLIEFGRFHAVIYTVILVFLTYSFTIIVYRVFLFIAPLEEGALAHGSRGEFIAQVNILFYLMIFNSLIRTHFLPVPLQTLVYALLGTKIGSNSFTAGVILDPPLTEIGKNTIIGHDAVLYSHAIEGQHFALSRIKIGDNVTIGAHAIIMSDVHIEDSAIISAGAVVKKGERIGAAEKWGGVPAKRIR